MRGNTGFSKSIVSFLVSALLVLTTVASAGPLDDFVSAINSGDAVATTHARGGLERAALYATRPGATHEREALAERLAELLTTSGNEAILGECLYLLSIVGSDAHVPAVAAVLANPIVGDEARMALQRIPGDAATRALLTALDSAEGDLRLRIVEALAARGAVEAIPALQKLTKEANPKLQWVVLVALGDLGVPPAQVTELTASFTPRENVIYTNAFLKAAFARLQRGETKIAGRMFTAAVGYYYYPYQACAALTGMEASRAQAFFRQAMGFIDQPGIRPVAVDLLSRTDMDGADDLLRRAYDVVSGSPKVTLLEILSARKAPSSDAVIAGAMNGPAELRYAARRITGETQTIEDLKAVAISGTLWRRDDAAHELLERAIAVREEGDSEAARAIFEVIAANPMTVSVRVNALSALEAMAAPESLPVVRSIKDALFVAKHLQESYPRRRADEIDLQVQEIGSDESSRATIRRPAESTGPRPDPAAAGVINDEGFALALDRAYVSILASMENRAAIQALGASTDSDELKAFVDATLERMKGN